MAEEQVVIGGYRRVNVLQTGQNSEIWEVCEVDGHKRFTMKLLLPERVDDPDQRKMLKHEATVGLSLKHPKIIKFHSFKNDAHNPYILLDLFPSLNLKLRILRNQFEEFIKPRLRSIIDQSAMAIDYFHSKGWVHRDIKPDNILVNNVGEVRLIDFALAVRKATALSRLFAKKGLTAGTRSYMSPEQILGKPLDSRADLYSYGVTLYEAIVGKLPFVASTAQELFQKHLRDTAPKLPESKGVTPEFSELVQRLLAKKPQDRPKSFEEVRMQIRSMKLFKDEPDAAEQ